MGMLKFDVTHQLSKDEALRRAKKLLEHWGTKYGIQTRWEGDTAHLDGKVMGITLQGHMTITPSGVNGEASDPGMLFRNKARKYLEEKFAEALDPTRNVDDLIGRA
jgi:hypothetical protein